MRAEADGHVLRSTVSCQQAQERVSNSFTVVISLLLLAGKRPRKHGRSFSQDDFEPARVAAGRRRRRTYLALELDPSSGPVMMNQ